MKITSNEAMRWSVDEHEGILDQPPERLEEPGADGAVDDAVVAAHRHAHALADDGGAVLDDRPVLRGADGEDGRLRRVDDGRELVDAEHAKVRDRERGAGVLLGLELALARPLRE